MNCDPSHDISFFMLRPLWGASVRFFVPSSFLGGAARDTWGYLVSVSSAELEQRVDVRGTLGFGESRPDRLMILPVTPDAGATRSAAGARTIRCSRRSSTSSCRPAQLRKPR
jgi:hypothetical protein